ncbi:DUF4129 domain-containing protein [Ornithinibacillus caprae]|nr:DUF4129 domain-containing protein [Ornithinibacillus caprae]
MENIDKAKSEIEEILNNREYQVYYEDQRSIFDIWWDKLSAWFGDLLSKLFADLNPSSGFADTLLILLIGVVILLIAVAIFLSIRLIRRKRVFQEHQPLLSKSEMEWSVNRHLKEAEKHEEMGDYSTATRHIFLALLLYFHEKEWLIAQVWKTNWEYFDELQKSNTNRASAFYRLAHLFDEVVYGERNLEEKEYIAYRQDALKWIHREDNGMVEEG